MAGTDAISAAEIEQAEARANVLESDAARAGASAREIRASLGRHHLDAPFAGVRVELIRARVRPVFMTTVTSLAGLLPMVLFPGSGSELYRGVGAIVLGGLLLGTLLTLFVVPALFTLVWRLRGAVVHDSTT